ncbi:MAG: Xaa-Pro peptidase family protein [Methanomassiliicoccales archaeon]
MNEHAFFSNLGEKVPLILVNGTKGFADPNFFYFSGISFGVFEHCAAVVKEEGTTVISNRLDSKAAEMSGCNVSVFSTREDLLNIILKETGGSERIALNFSKLPVEWYQLLRKHLPETQFIDASAALQQTREVKNEHEIEHHRKACSITIKAFDEAIGQLKEGMTESEFASKLIYALLINGSGFPYAEPTVAFGENAAFPHYSAGSRKLHSGDVVLMDFGATASRYVSDITRTVVFGRASDAIKEAYDIVNKAREAGIHAMREGETGGAVDSAARRVIDASGFSGKFIHGFGHGVGLEIHDHPCFSPSSAVRLKGNMVVTAEPGVYLPGEFGIRIEDNLVIKKNGAENLTPDRHELIEI